MGKQGKINIPMMLACVLLCLTLITTHLTGGLFARYTAKGEGGDSARVAKFHVTGTPEATVTINSNADRDETYMLTVTNHSEVAIEYDLDITFLAEVTGWMDLTITDAIVTEDTNKTTFHADDAGTLAPGGVATHEITFQVESWNEITKNMTGKEGTEELKFTVNIHATQID